MNHTEKPASLAGRAWNLFTVEPLIPFAIVGGLLFVVYGFARPAPREIIKVSPQTIQAIVNFESSLRGYELSEPQRQAAIDSYIEDEILMREALGRGLERKDSRVRKRLLSVMRSSLDETVPEPTRAELEAHFRAKADLFAEKEVMQLEQVYFSFGNEPADTEVVLQQLQKGADPKKMGDRFWAGGQRPMTRNDMLNNFGLVATDLAFAAKTTEWFGPVESPQGWHYFRILARQKQPPPTFEQVEDYLRQDWMFSKRREIQTRKIDEMRKKYRVVFSEE